MNKTIVLKDYEETRFEKTIKNIDVDISLPTLPLIHKVESHKQSDPNKLSAIDYFESGCILPVPCDVFGEDLIYTFVGRPSYRELDMPVCFVIKPAPELLQNIFIFDSGAYFENRYSKIVDNELDINRFRIPASEDMIKKFIVHNFGENTCYYFGLPKEPEHHEIMDSVEEFDYAMLKKIMEFHKVNFDTRCRTIENIIRTSIPLNKYLMAIILPKSMMEDESFKEFSKVLGDKIDILDYYDNDGQYDRHQCNRGMDKVLLDYYLKKGFISV